MARFPFQPSQSCSRHLLPVFFGYLHFQSTNYSFGRTLGSYVSMLYVFVKFLYLFNVIAQLYIMNRFLGSEYTFWGWEVSVPVVHDETSVQTLTDLWSGREWAESGVFPRVTLCDFRIRRLANIHRYTVQCVLMLNMFNEKIFLFLW